MEALYRLVYIFLVVFLLADDSSGLGGLLARGASSLSTNDVRQALNGSNAANDLVMRLVNITTQKLTGQYLDASILQDETKVKKLIEQGLQLAPINPETKEILSNVTNMYYGGTPDPKQIVNLASAGVKWAAFNPKTKEMISLSSINSILKNFEELKDIHQTYNEGNTGDAAWKLVNLTSNKITGLDASSLKDPKVVAKLVGQGSSYLKINPVTKEVITDVTDIINNNMTCTSQDIGRMVTNIASLLLAHGVITYATFGLVNPATSVLLGVGSRFVADLLSSSNTRSPAGTNQLEEKIQDLTNSGVPPMEALNKVLDSLEPEAIDFNDKPKVKLGCNNQNIGKVFRRAASSLGADSKKKAEWGSSSTVTSMMFNDSGSLNKFIADLNEISASVMETTTYNDLDQLIKFITEYKSQTRKTLQSFYQSYEYKFRPQEDCAVFEMKLVHMLKKKYAQVVDHFYLVTAYMDVPEKFINSPKNKLLGKHETNEEFFHGHVAGAIKISLISGSQIRNGLILMDLTLGLEKPIILMDDNKYPHYDTTMRGFGKKITYRFVGPENSYVLAEIYKDQPSTNGEKIILSKHLYFVRKPYCSYLEVTFKPNLLIPVHGMVSRLSNGIKKAQVNFRILPKNILGTDFYFNVVSFNSNTEADGIGRRIPFESLKNVANMSFVEINDIKLAATGLGMNADLLVGKLAAIKALIIDDNQLIADLYRLNWRMNFVDYRSNDTVKKTQDPGKDGKPAEESLVSYKSIRNMFTWASKSVANTWNQKRNDFLNATEKQNEFVKKIHITNTH